MAQGGCFMPVQPFVFSPWIVAAFVAWTIGALLILIDLYRMRLKHQRGEPSSWYARPTLWFASCAFPLGLIAILLSVPWSPYSPFLYGMIAAFLLILFFVVGGLIAVVRWDLQQVALQQETRLRQLAASSPSIVSASRPTTNMAMVGMTIVGSLLFFFALLDTISFYTDQFTYGIWWLAFPVVFFLLLITSIFTWLSALSRFYKRLNRRKTMLASEYHHPIIFNPVSQESLQALMPPLVLRLKTSIIVSYLAFIAGYVLLMLYPVGSVNDINHTIPLVNILFYPAFSLFLLLSGMRERLEATTQTLTVRRGMWFVKMKQQLPWQEARLFACYQSFSFFKGQKTMIYELAGPARAVQWTRVINARSLFVPWKTELPTDEYNRQTQELCAFITRQTGLHLRNLSEESSRVREQEILIHIQPPK
jgi:hypothetical protein